MRANDVQEDTKTPSLCKAFAVLFTTNSLFPLKRFQKDKTLGEPPLGPGSPEVAHR